MKIGIITDTHHGIRNDNQAFHRYAKKFYDNVFFPRMKKEGIHLVFHLGDIVDRRKYISFATAKSLREDFMSKFEENEISLVALLGNHDVTYKNTNSLNALDELYGDSEWIEIVRGPKEYTILAREDGTVEKVLLLPWINPENMDESLEAIKKTDAPVCFGHLEMNGFEFYRGQVSNHGLEKTLFTKFDQVFSGHYHHKSSRENIHYLGAAMEFTWADFNDDRGFHIYDTTTRELEFVPNPYKMFRKFFYDDSMKDLEDILEEDFESYKECIVKVVVQNRDNPYWFDVFMDRLEKVGPIDVQVVEDHHNLDQDSEEDMIDEAEDTVTIINKTVDQMATNVKKQKLKSLMSELYQEALTLE